MRSLKELAEVALSVNRSASRVGETYRLNHDRLKSMGYTPDDLDRVERAVRMIEHFTDETLRGLPVSNGDRTDG